MKRLFLIILISFLFSKSWSQELNCTDFKIGNFYIPMNKNKQDKMSLITNEEQKDFVYEIDSSLEKYVIIRDEKTQIEWKNGINKGTPEYEIIEWIDDCTYKLTYDSSKMDLKEDQKWINDNGGLIVSKIKIEGKCMFYIANLTTNEGNKISQEGIICKE